LKKTVLDRGQSATTLPRNHAHTRYTSPNASPRHRAADWYNN